METILITSAVALTMIAIFVSFYILKLKDTIQIKDEAYYTLFDAYMQERARVHELETREIKTIKNNVGEILNVMEKSDFVDIERNEDETIIRYIDEEYPSIKIRKCNEKRNKLQNKCR